MKKKLLIAVLFALLMVANSAGAKVLERGSRTFTSPAGVTYTLEYDSEWKTDVGNLEYYIYWYEINITDYPEVEGNSKASGSPEVTMKVRSYDIGGTAPGENTFADYLDTDCTVTYTKTANWEVRGGGPNVTITRQAEKAHNWGAWQRNPNGTYTRTCQHPVCTITETCQHTNASWVSSAPTEHWQACECGYVGPRNPHVYADDQALACKDCGHARAAYTLTFLPNGGEGIMTSQTFLEKAAQSLKNNAFFRNGYQFAGWSTRPDGSGTLLKDGATIQLSAPTELYAVW